MGKGCFILMDSRSSSPSKPIVCTHRKHHDSILGVKGLTDMFPLSNVIVHSGLCEVSL